jgi:predicted dehydrogenase/nucleoside-diphosphate-sugar epimerase
MKLRRIALVGAGFISRVHIEALAGISGVRTTAIVDPNREAAGALARAYRIDAVYRSVQEALAADGFDCAHVLVPPDLHAPVALELIAAGKPVLLEKPAATSVAECVEVIAAGQAAGTTIGVNQNFVYHPAFARLRRLVQARGLGKPNFLSCIYNVPLRQLAARQFSHWMFRQPVNILLEQAVHPLSQIAALAGPIRGTKALAGPAVEIAPGKDFHSSLNLLLDCEHLPAEMRFAVGQEFPFWQITVVCDDGVAVADMLANRFFTYEHTRWMEAVDGVASGTRTGAALVRESWRNMLDYGLSTLKLKPRTDAFFQSMQGSVKAFHAALDANTTPECDIRFGKMLVRTCEELRDQVFRPAAAAAAASPESAGPSVNADVAVLGGTGFIGTQVVTQMVAAGMRVSVMARNTANLPSVFADPRVTLHRGSIRDAAAVEAAIGDAPVVVNLAHGGGGADYEAIRTAMVGGAETVARACLARGVRRLIHVGSIASLYLGPQPGPVIDAAPPDGQSEKRADYARAKAVSDRMLADMHTRDGLPVCILRPGVVVGEGSSPFHSGIGFYNTEQHCIGWNAGRNPLPFVLVDDVAKAILLACTAPGIEGKTYNLAGDVRLSGREYITALARALERPLRYHPQSPTLLWAEDVAKWGVKRATGRSVPLPSRRDFLSRGMRAEFDCSAAKRDLGWQPVADRDQFVRRAILVHAAPANDA